MDAPPIKKQCLDDINGKEDNNDKGDNSGKADNVDNVDSSINNVQKPENCKESAQIGKEPDPLNCRLRYLDNDCLMSIFEYLSMKDLLHVYELDDYFESIITDHIIPTKLVDFTKTGDHWTTNKIFRTFGKKMRRIKIVEENTRYQFQQFLNFVIEFCAPDRLIELQLRYHSTEVDPVIMQQAIPYFRKLQKLVLQRQDDRSAFDSFMSSICNASIRIKSLNLLGVKLFPGWSTTESLNNLEEIRMHVRSPHTTLGMRVADLPDFIRTKQHLKLFSYIGHENITAITRILSEHCRGLETYNDFNLDIQTTVNDYRTLASYHERYNYIAVLPNIKHLAITTYSPFGDDLHYALMRLVKLTTLESLIILINADAVFNLSRTEMQEASDRWLAQLSPQSFQQLKSVGLRIVSETKDMFEFDCKFICKFLQHLSSLSKITICVDRHIMNVFKILEYVPRIRTLSVAKTRMRHLPVEMLKIHRAVRKMHQQRDGLPPIHLITNIQQHRELQVCVFLFFSSFALALDCFFRYLNQFSSLLICRNRFMMVFMILPHSLLTLMILDSTPAN